MRDERCRSIAYDDAFENYIRYLRFSKCSSQLYTDSRGERDRRTGDVHYRRRSSRSLADRIALPISLLYCCEAWAGLELYNRDHDPRKAYRFDASTNRVTKPNRTTKPVLSASYFILFAAAAAAAAAQLHKVSVETRTLALR